MNKMTNQYSPDAEGLMAVLRRLRAPGGCPWDREQTRQTLSRCLIEECAELVEAIDHDNPAEIREELGDLLMNALFQAEIAEEKNEFTLEDVWAEVIAKMIRRHAHVFGDASAENSEEVLKLWGEIKATEHTEAKKSSLLDGVPAQLSALARAEKLQKKASKVGFDWPDAKGAWEKLKEEALETASAIDSKDEDKIDEELGDLLFSIVNVCRLRKRATAEELLRAANRKFETRFRFIEAELQKNGEDIQKTSLERLDELWNLAKKSEGLGI
jgi:MazG family protein